MLGNLLTKWKPSVYQGGRNPKGYFEGWYFKLVDTGADNILAVIPGVSFSPDGEAHCFIQVLDGKAVSSRYFRYSINEFSYSLDKFLIKIGESTFSDSGLELNISQDGQQLAGSLRFEGLKPWPVSLALPGAMGWYALVPFMECYHGVLSFDHVLFGKLSVNGRVINFSGGRGYIEKDWGKSFPRYYVWGQSNHFDKPGTSMTFSAANIPWRGRSFDGFIAGFLLDGRLYIFTTYNGSRITRFDVTPRTLLAHFQSDSFRLEMEARKSSAALLAAPRLGDMDGRISESITSGIAVRLVKKSRHQEDILFEGNGLNAGLEISGDISKFRVV
jgi:tocopherol cyclase